MTSDQIVAIREQFFKRIEDSQQRTKIIQLASIMADTHFDKTPQLDSSGQEIDDDKRRENDFWSAVYYYSLPENRTQFENDYEEFKYDA